jgi:hypothetical protein
MLDDSEYTPEELDGLNTWFQLEHDKLPTWPFTFHFVKLKSGSEELTELIMDPVKTLRGNGPALAALPGVNAETTVTTTIFGHERTLTARLMYAVATVDSQSNSVALTTHKAKDKPGS